MRISRFRRTLCEEAAGEWRIDERTALLLFILPFAGAAVVGLSRVNLSLFQFLTAEDRLLEWSQFAGYALTSGLAALLARRLLQTRETLLAAAYVTVALGALFIAGEEISWGQRIAGVETPEHLQELNRQGELGLHNVYTVETAFNLCLLAVGLYGSIGAFAVRTRGWRSGDPALAFLVPPLFLTSFFLLLFLHRLLRFTIPELTDLTPFVKFGEWPELCLAAALAIFCALNLRRLSRGEDS